jgi:hypothetical protein
VLARAPLDDPQDGFVLSALSEWERRCRVVDHFLRWVERGTVVGDRQRLVVEEERREVRSQGREHVVRFERAQRPLFVVVRGDDRAGRGCG